MNISMRLSVLAVLATLTLSCSKNNDAPDQGDGTGLKGKLLYTFVGTVSELDLSSNEKRVYFTYNTYGFGDWSMSWDYQYRLLSEREPGEYYATKFTRVKNSDGIIVDEFDYVPPQGNGTGFGGQPSPDNTQVLIAPSLEDGLVITDLEGNHLHYFEAIDVGGTTIPLDLGDEALWLPDNSILFTLDDRYILKSSPPYAQVSLVREMPYTQWGNLSVSHDGTQLALQIDLHIYVMNLDGGDPVQATDGSGMERSARFSPDGKYLVVEKKYGDIASWNLALVPNDGKVHDMYDDDAVIVVQPKGDIIPATFSGQYYWIP